MPHSENSVSTRAPVIGSVRRTVSSRILFSLLSIILLTCNGALASEMRTITDMRGRQVTFQTPLSRVALLGGPTGQVAYLLGVEDRLCAVTNTLRMSKLLVEIHPGIKELPGPRTVCGNINIEELIASRPDLVIAGDIDGDIVLDKTRIPVAFLADSMGQGMADIFREIEFYGIIFQRQARAARYIQWVSDTVKRIKQRTSSIPESERKHVFHGYSPSYLVTLGGDTFMQERIEISGCRNSAKPVATTGKRTGLHSGLAEVSMEQVLGWNPDIIVINYGTPEHLTQNPRWRAVKAVQEGQVYSQPAGIFIFNRPTAESAALYSLWLAATAYPHLFRDLSLTKEFGRFYKEIFDFDLTEFQVKSILNGDYEARIMKGAHH